MTKANSINVKVAARIASSNAGRNGPFNKEQVFAVEKHYDEWYNFAFVKHPNIGGHGTSGILTKWKQDKAKEIMQGTEFKVLPEGHDYKQTIESIVRKFTNWRNSRKKQIEDRTVEIEAMKNAAAVLLDTKNYSRGRDLFKQRNHAEIVVRKTEILLRGEVSSSVGAYQRAWKELWDEVDHEEWERMAQSDGGRVFRDQNLFASACFTGLRGLAQGGGLGNMEMLVFYAHRDQKGHVLSSLLEVHHDDQTGNFSDNELGVDAEGLQHAFESWCDRVLPRDGKLTTEDNTIVLLRAASGLPLFPEMDLDREPAISISKTLQVYFEYTWEHSHPGDLRLPWDEIAANPSHFYDNKLYILDIPITDPSTLSSTDVLKMALCLSRLSQPFAFWREPPGWRERTPCRSHDDPEELWAGDNEEDHTIARGPTHGADLSFSQTPSHAIPPTANDPKLSIPPQSVSLPTTVQLARLPSTNMLSATPRSPSQTHQSDGYAVPSTRPSLPIQSPPLQSRHRSPTIRGSSPTIQVSSSIAQHPSANRRSPLPAINFPPAAQPSSVPRSPSAMTQPPALVIHSHSPTTERSQVFSGTSQTPSQTDEPPTQPIKTSPPNAHPHTHYITPSLPSQARHHSPTIHASPASIQSTPADRSSPYLHPTSRQPSKLHPTLNPLQ